MGQGGLNKRMNGMEKVAFNIAIWVQLSHSDRAIKTKQTYSTVLGDVPV